MQKKRQYKKRKNLRIKKSDLSRLRIRKRDIKIVIPIYNEARAIGGLLDELVKLGWANSVICVDDHSTDNSKDIILKYPVHYMRLIINRGQGGAIRTGNEAAIQMGAKIIVHMDGDHQHKPTEITNLVKPVLSKKYDVALGSRLKDRKNMPLVRRIANTIGNMITRILFGITVSDSQSGYRAISDKAAKKMVLKTNGMEVCSEIISQIKKQKLRYIEVPITAVYTNYSLSKGQSFFKGIKTMIKLIVNRLQ